MKILGTLVAVLLSSVLLSPAAAEQGISRVEGGVEIEATYPICMEYSSFPKKKTCLRLEWQLQGDGSGVRLRSWQITTPEGCGSLESEYGGDRRYNQTRFRWIDRFGEEKVTYYPEYMSCTWTYGALANPNLIGTHTGAMNFTLRTQARVNNGGDSFLCWGVRIMEDGYYNVYRKLEWHVSSVDNGCEKSSL